MTPGRLIILPRAIAIKWECGCTTSSRSHPKRFQRNIPTKEYTKNFKKNKLCDSMRFMENAIRRLNVAARRAAVAKLVARGFDVSSTANKLNKLGYRTANGKPLSPTIVGKDLKVIEEEWLQRASADITRHKARQLHELQKIKQEGWKTSNFDLVLKVLDKEMALLGTKVTAIDKESPKYVKNETNNQQFNILTVDQRDAGIIKILETARARKAELIAAGGPSVDPVTTPAESV